ncbi:MAG: flavodoxin [Treponema sp.]|nr:flavodoxin [Treponema sp.]
MKIKSIIVAAVVALFATSSLSAKSLVIYFSRADENYGVGTITEGNTAILAKMIAQKTGSDIFEIIPEKAYPKSYNECINVAKDEQRKKSRPAYKSNIDTSSYDTIYIGYPIWWGDLPMVVYTFLEAHDLSGKTIVPFCTHEGSGLSGTDNNIKRLYKNVTMKPALAVRGTAAQNKRKETEKAVDEWLKE